MPDVNAPGTGTAPGLPELRQPAEDVARDIAEALRTSGLHVLVRGVGTGCRRLHSGAN